MDALSARRARAYIETRGTGHARLVRRTLKVSELIALEIVRDIVEQGLQPGDKLPLEPDMLAYYKVSRSSLREALRLLEVQGLIAIRTGPGASTVVGQTHPANLARTTMLYLHLSGTTYGQLFAAWAQTEPLLARLAAQNPDRERVRAMMEPFANEHDPAHCLDVPITQGVAFHDAVAQLADNPVLDLMFQTIGHLISDYTLNVVETRTLDGGFQHDHVDLAHAIIDGDADRAQTLMAEHIGHVFDYFKSYWPTKLGERVESFPRARLDSGAGRAP